MFFSINYYKFIKMKLEIINRIVSLCNFMCKYKFLVFIIFSMDFYLGEYIFKYWEVCKWILGFIGLVGMVVVILDKVGFWIDLCYFF